MNEAKVIQPNVNINEPCVFVSRGNGGWGKGLYLRRNGKRNLIASLTGGGIHPVAKKIGELLDCPVIDAFEEKVDLEEMLCVVLDCGGTARMGVYPMKKILTINVKPASPSGPLVQHITEDVFVSGVTVNDVKVAINEDVQKPHDNIVQKDDIKPFQHVTNSNHAKKENDSLKILTLPAKAVAYSMGFIYQAGKEAVNSFITHVLPLMLGISAIIGTFHLLNLESVLSTLTRYTMGNLLGLVMMAIIFSIPIFSNYLGAGATLGQVLVVILGYQIALGNVDFIWLIPALFATNVQVGCDFLPTALSMSNSEKRTVRAGLKAVAYGRLITSVISVLIPYFLALLIGL